MKHINQKNLLEYLNNLDSKTLDYQFNVYKTWNSLVEGHQLNLIKVGQIEQESTEQTDRYWGEDSPIKLNVYPYSSCEIHQCMDSKKLFFYYLELSGHRPEK